MVTEEKFASRARKKTRWYAKQQNKKEKGKTNRKVKIHAWKVYQKFSKNKRCANLKTKHRSTRVTKGACNYHTHLSTFSPPKTVSTTPRVHNNF